MAEGLPDWLAAVLVCPACRGELTRGPEGLSCEACRLLYPVREGIPRLVPEEARRLDDGRGP